MDSSDVNCVNPTISVQTPARGLARTPSTDSVATEILGASYMDNKLSLKNLQMEHRSPSLRVSFRAGNLPVSRGPSPSPGLSDRLSVPSHTNRPKSPANRSVAEIWLDDDNDLIRSCGALAKALGLEKSFSTSDILTAPDVIASLRQSRSETFLLDAVNHHWGKLEPNSRSLSTWVAVGDVQSSTSQLPSPQVEHNKWFPDGPGAHFTAADFVRSVNKTVRQNYIKKRLKVTYKALEQFAESEFDLDRLLASKKHNPSANKHNKSNAKKIETDKMAKVLVTVQSDLGLSELGSSDEIVSTKEIERDRGKPISKYERNIMIFDWLHGLDESATYDVAH